MTLLATFKHISSKNADYGAAEAYLTFEHDEFTMKPTLDENGRLIPREDYRISSLNCGGEDFAVACMRANLRYEKNQKREDVKSHHYIISFDPRDGTDNSLTVDRAQELGEQFCKAHFPGHQALVCTHPDGHNHSGNIHVHIVINSLRIYGTRAFTKKYGRKQIIGRVQTPTLAMLAERQNKIQNFVKEPYYKVELSGAGVVAVSEQMGREQDADTMQAACDGQCAVVGSIERKRVEKKPPKLYDLTTLQREANRYYGLTASQTLQALQELYEEKLVTYPRTDSHFVTEDMRKTVESLVLVLDGATADVSCVINNSKVTDHHAILPTMQSVKCNREKLSETKRKILSLVAWKLVQAVQPPFIYEDVLVTVCCQGRNFTAKYKDVLQPGYTAKPVPFAEPEKDKDVPLPKKMEQGMVLPMVRAEKKQGFTSPPKVYTEDTLLSAMETAGNKEFEKDTEKKGLGTPATRAAILEKLVSAGYVQRKGNQMIPTEDGVAAIRNIPDYLKSASMTAEWENDLLRMERGEIKPYDFMQGIHGLIDKMLADLRQIPTVAAAPNHNKVSVGNCPVCGNPVHESKLSFCCADRSCKFALWKESRYLSNMRKTLDKKMATDLLQKGRTHVKDFYSTKKDKTFAADLVMRVEDGRAQYSLEFPKTPMKTKT